MIFSRVWAMPNKNTFSIKPIREFIQKWKEESPYLWIDPFVGENEFADEGNDLNPDVLAEYHMDAIDYLKKKQPGSEVSCFFDPPYSPRQISEMYKSVGIATNMQTTQSKWYSDIKKEISRITKQRSLVISAGWNSNGVGMCNGFELLAQLNVPHGGWHNDTIVIVERKIS